MQVAVIGAGAVGCYYGGLLLKAGHDVTFVGRPPHVDAINAHGLLLDTQTFRGHLPAKAATDAGALAAPDLVLFCVKSADTEQAGRSLAGRLRPETTVLSLQNGVDNPQRLRSVTGHPVIAAVVYVGSEMAGPGHVRHHGGGHLVIGASPESEALARTLEAAGIRTTIAEDIERTQWTKLITNCAFNALSAVAGIAYGPLLDVEGAKDVVASAIEEAAAVARACGVPDAGRPRRAGPESSCRDAEPEVLHRAGSRARQAQRDRLPQRLYRAQGRRARHSRSDQSGPAGDGEAGGTQQRDIRETGVRMLRYPAS
jgi:2-dehydropantoate 2-reductase